MECPLILFFANILLPGENSRSDKETDAWRQAQSLTIEMITRKYPTPSNGNECDRRTRQKTRRMFVFMDEGA